MTAETAASRAAAARLARRPRPTLSPAGGVKDPCPGCGAELGQPHGASRRLVVFTTARGQFRWQCPDCRTAWTERASTQVGSTTRGVAGDLGPAQVSSNQTTLPTPSR